MGLAVRGDCSGETWASTVGDPSFNTSDSNCVNHFVSVLPSVRASVAVQLFIFKYIIIFCAHHRRKPVVLKANTAKTRYVKCCRPADGVHQAVRAVEERRTQVELGAIFIHFL